LTTAQIVGWDPYETINRIHMRYYNFIFPLFYIIAAGGLSANTSSNTVKKYITLILFSFAYLYAIVYLKNYYNISFIDCPELFGFIYNNTFYKMLSFLGLFCLILWIINKNWGSKVYVFLFLPLFLIISTCNVHIELQKERLHFTDAYDRAGLFVREFLSDDLSRLVVVGSERGGLYKTLFYFDNPKTSISELPANIPIEFAKILIDTKWILFIGEYPVLRKPLFQLSMGDYTLIKIKQ
jgi:phosphoglycerol transferase